MNREEFNLRHLDRYEEYLLNQLQCPACGANWQSIEESFGNDGYDREMALLIVNNCKTCYNHFAYMLPTYSVLEFELVGGQ